jgi:hypothetical protein
MLMPLVTAVGRTRQGQNPRTKDTQTRTGKIVDGRDSRVAERLGPGSPVSEYLSENRRPG